MLSKYIMNIYHESTFPLRCNYFYSDLNKRAMNYVYINNLSLTHSTCKRKLLVTLFKSLTINGLWSIWCIATIIKKKRPSNIRNVEINFPPVVLEHRWNMNTGHQIVVWATKMAVPSLESLLVWISVPMHTETSTTCRVAALW